MPNRLVAAVFGSSNDAVIKAGTLAVTRGMGVVAVGMNGVFAVLDANDKGPWKDLTSFQKIIFVLVSGGIWAVLAGADAIARAHASHLVTLPPGLKAKTTVDVDESGWTVVAIQGGSQYLLVKPDAEPQWLTVDKFKFE